LGTAAHPEPADSVVRIRPGAFYGWPRCWPSFQRKVLAGRCRGGAAPLADPQPHPSAGGLAVLGGGPVVAVLGPEPCGRPGRRLVRIDLGPRGRARAVTTFASGFEHPLALVVDRHGGLLVADWSRGVIYRIQSRGG